MDSNSLRYPIGPFHLDPDNAPAKRQRRMERLAEHPSRLRDAVRDLTPDQLDTPYRPDGWTVRQVVHHLADSQMHGYMRMRWALTEDVPTVPVYAQDGWAALPDAATQPVRSSLQLIEALYERWMALLRGLAATSFGRAFHHPEHGRLTVDDALQMYDWHGRHHVAHVTRLREREGWDAG